MDTDVRISAGAKLFLEILPLDFICLCTEIYLLQSLHHMAVESKNLNCEQKPHCDEY